MHRVVKVEWFLIKGIIITILYKNGNQTYFNKLLEEYPNINAVSLHDEIDKSI